MPAEDVIRSALAVDRALIQFYFYRSLATSLVAPRVLELFLNLLEMEESKGREHSKTAAELLEERG